MIMATTWTKQKLGDLAEIVMGQSPESRYYNETGDGLPFFQGVKDFGFKYPSITKWTTSANKIADKNDILFSVRAPVGDINVAKAKCALGRGVCGIKSKNNQNDFLYFLLLANAKKIINIGNGAIYNSINKPTLEKVELIVPEVAVRTHIASVLSAYDDLIENNEKRIKILEEMAQLLYMEWFVKFKFPGHKKIKMVESGTEFGKIPEGWKVGNFVNSEIYLSCKDRIKKFEGEKLYFDTSCVDEIRIVKEPLNVDWNTMPSRAQFFPVYNSVWFARMAKTYKVLVFDKRSDFEVNNYLLSSGMLGIKTEEKYLGFLFALIKSEAFHKQKDSKATGATQVSLTDEGFSAIQIVFPSIELIEKYSNIVNGYIGQILALQKQNKNLSQIRDLLIPQLVTGKRGLK